MPDTQSEKVAIHMCALQNKNLTLCLINSEKVAIHMCALQNKNLTLRQIHKVRKLQYTCVHYKIRT